MATAEKFLIRFTDDMRARLAEAAEQNRRSMNAEILARLRSTFDEVTPVEARVAALEKAVAQLQKKGK
jgi:ubiquinone biosynthesis protein UbiJ